MLSRFRGLAARLAATAAVGGLAITAGASLLDGGLVIVVQNAVYGGTPIVGYATGTTPDTVAEAFGPQGLPLNPPPPPPPPPGSPPPSGIVPIVEDPLYFAFATTESMAICIVTVHVFDSQHTAVAPVLVQ